VHSDNSIANDIAPLDSVASKAEDFGNCFGARNKYLAPVKALASHPLTCLLAFAAASLRCHGNEPPVAAELYSSTRAIPAEIYEAEIHFQAVDPDGDSVTVVAVGTPQHGTVTRVERYGNRIIQYVPDTTFTGRDSFSYIIADPSGAESTGIIAIRDPAAIFSDAAGTYESLFVDPNLGEPPGSITMQLRDDGTFTGRFFFFGASYSVQGKISDLGTAEMQIPRRDNPPFYFQLYLDDYFRSPQLGAGLQQIGADWTSIPVSAVSREGDTIEAGQFNVVLPTPENVLLVAAEQPQGNGFALMKARRRGSVTTIGRLGDNQPFAEGGHVQRDGALLLFANYGAQREGKLYGRIDLRAQGSSAREVGQLNWYHPIKSFGPYSGGFALTVRAMGERFHAPPRGGSLFSTSGEPTNLGVSVRDHTGATILAATAPLQFHRLAATSADGTGLRLRINPRNGLFSARLSRPAQRAEVVRGVVQPGQRFGAGVFGRTGADAAVEISVQE
jgi:hypothetical protein